MKTSTSLLLLFFVFYGHVAQAIPADPFNLFFNPNTALSYETSLLMGVLKTTFCCTVMASCFPHKDTVIYGLGFVWYFLKRTVLDSLLSRIIKDDYNKAFIYLLKLCGARVDARVLLQACRDDDTDLALRYVYYGANVKAARYYYPFFGDVYRYADEDRTCALSLACFNGNKQIVESLLKAGADINDVDFCYKKPLYFACKTIKGLRLLNYLMVNGANAVCFAHNGLCMEFCKNLAFVLSEVKNGVDNSDALLSDVIYHIANKNIDYGDIRYKEWLYQLLDTLYHCIKDKNKRRNLLQHLCTDSCLREIILEYAIKYDDRNFFRCELHKEDSAEWVEDIFLKACARHKPKITVYLYTVYRDKLLFNNSQERTSLAAIASRSALCFKELVSNNMVLPKDLHLKNACHITVFYNGVKSGAIDSLTNFHWLKENDKKAQFLHQELLNIAQGNSDERVETVMQFCRDNGACFDYKQLYGKELIDRVMQSFKNDLIFHQQKKVFSLFMQGFTEKDRTELSHKAGELLFY